VVSLLAFSSLLLAVFGSSQERERDREMNDYVLWEELTKVEAVEGTAD
jgi:hypothetical protein